MAKKRDKATGKQMKRITRLANKAVTKTFSKPFSRMSVEKQCLAMISLMKVRGNYNLRADLLKSEAFPQDIRDLRKEKGWSDREIIDYYWDKKEFRDLWGMLEMDKEFFEYVVTTESRNEDK